LALFVFVCRNCSLWRWLVVFFFVAFGMLAMLTRPTAFGFEQNFVLPQEPAAVAIVNFIFSSHKRWWFRG
jgi:hypothetical protein